MRDVMHVEIPEKQPLVGKNFNVTKAGIHADGMLKNEEIYNIFDTKKVLNRPIAVGITDKSGTAGIVYWINTNLKLSENEKLTKDNPDVLKIKEEIDKDFESGRIIGISDEEMIDYVKKYLPSIYQKYGKNYEE
jgi:isopropylmalate/homocitrate/citramalate synthase